MSNWPLFNASQCTRCKKFTATHSSEAPTKEAFEDYMLKSRWRVIEENDTFNMQKMHYILCGDCYQNFKQWLNFVAQPEKQV